MLNFENQTLLQKQQMQGNLFNLYFVAINEIKRFTCIRVIGTFLTIVA